MSVAAHVVASTNHETIMRDADDTGCRSSAWWPLAALLVPTLMACGEGKILVPPAGAPTAPEPPLTAFIYIADANGAVPGELTAGDWPSWSPDGRRIVFHRDGHVRVVGADGVGDTELAAGQWPTWSPDGDRIAYATREGISVMNADGSAARLLMSPALFAMHATGGVREALMVPGRCAHRLRAPGIARRRGRRRLALDSCDVRRRGDPVLPGRLERIRDRAVVVARGLASRLLEQWLRHLGSSSAAADRPRACTRTARSRPTRGPAWCPDGRTIAFSTRGPV